ncbi:DUF2972 domain-containing protein [Campylobacter coli]|nr:DUF2972 domain-containing protein [Campylobacter coli]
MQNSRSAVDRIKNSLSYKLGFTILEHVKYKGIKYTTLPYKLYKIKKQYFKEQELYKQVIKIFPEFKYCKLESCEDYNESLRYRCHLSYMFGEVLIKAHKTWYKGGYFKIFYSLKEKYRLYQNIQEIISILPESLHYYFYNLIVKSYKINIQDLANIIKRHRNYMPILENIFHNFDFFICHFDIIYSWLSSDEFEEKYKHRNHPYPSLLDPIKLSDKNEKLNYNNISAELAWKINLPLPDTYKFACLSFGLAGHVALDLYLRKCSCVFIYANVESLQNLYLNSDTTKVLFISSIWKKNLLFQIKIIYLLNIQCPILVLVRDPIERLKTGVNHGYFATSTQKNYDYFSLNDDVDLVLERFKYHYKGKSGDLPFLENISIFLENSVFELDSFIQNIQNMIVYIDMKDIMPKQAFNTMQKLSKIFNFSMPKLEDRNYFSEIKYNEFKYRLPLIMNVDYCECRIQIYIESRMSSDDRINIFSLVFDDSHEFCNRVYFYIEKRYFEMINDKFIDYIKHYLEDFLIALKGKVDFDLKNRKNEIDVLDYMKKNDELLNKLRKILSKELVHIKQHRPDIVASWKYYQEFEKICKKIDEKE